MRPMWAVDGPGGTLEALTTSEFGSVSTCSCCGRWQLAFGPLVVVREVGWFCVLRDGLVERLRERRRGFGFPLAVELSPGTVRYLSVPEAQQLTALVDRALIEHGARMFTPGIAEA